MAIMFVIIEYVLFLDTPIDIIPKNVHTFHFNRYQMLCLTALKMYSFAASFLWQTSLSCFE